MDLREALSREHSKANTDAIARWIGSDPERFAELVDCLLSGDYRLVQRSAWVVSTVGCARPWLVVPHLDRLVHALEKPLHPAVQRNVLKLLAETELPLSEDAEGELVAHAFDLLEAPKAPVAIKVHAMQLLANACRRYPDLSVELRETIQAQLPEASAGFRSRARKILRQFDGT
ncbi:MAG: hypothetical protein KDC54_08830 [Lewinella sp.]|nr:hypothetical protein [Lewinella sp.]